MSTIEDAEAANLCPWDKRPCYVGRDTDDQHYRCGTSACGRNTSAATATSPTSDHNPLTLKDMRQSDVVERMCRAVELARFGQLLQQDGTYDLMTRYIAKAALEASYHAELVEENASLRAENERLSKAVCSGILGDLLAPDENEALLAFVKTLRAAKIGDRT